LVLVAGVLAWGRNEFLRPGPLDEDTVFTVERGEQLGKIAERLENEGIITSAQIFRIGARALKQEDDLKYGEYAVLANSAMNSVLELLTSGQSIVYWVTIPEGFSVRQTIERLNSTEQLTGEIANVPDEGTLSPNTYAVQRGDTRQSVVDRMAEAQDTILAGAWAERNPDLALGSPEEALVLASIIEKETGVSSERAEVSAVLHNRLRSGWRLQSDPTVIYGITKGSGPLGRGLRESELARATPYTTYVINGLPPTPIANPGQAAIKAAVQPNESNNMFFVADGNGGHLFAVTLAEHNRNVAKWRQVERERQENQ